MAAQSQGCVELLDRECTKTIGMVSAVEPCDLLREGCEFIHVKRGTRSQSLSHLFNQGLVSAELFLHRGDYRRELLKRVSMQGLAANALLPPNARNYSIVFAA